MSRARIWLLILLVSCAGPQRRPEPERVASVHALLVGIEIQEARRTVPYDRDDWQKRWDDADGDCQDTRVEVLLRDAVRATLNASGCKVIQGEWHDPYTGKTYTRPSDIDIDHMVPLGEAHRSGGYRWSSARKHEYANYLANGFHLLAVEDNANQSKSDHSPDEWMPANQAYHCVYVENWSRIKREWELTMTRVEFEFVNAKLNACDASSR